MPSFTVKLVRVNYRVEVLQNSLEPVGFQFGNPLSFGVYSFFKTVVKAIMVFSVFSASLQAIFLASISRVFHFHFTFLNSTKPLLQSKHKNTLRSLVKTMTGLIEDFVSEYFVNPILYQDKYPPYNVYNTAVYAVVAIAVVYLLFSIFRRKGVEINGAFFKAIFPFVVFGSVLRVGEDGGVVPLVVEIAGVQLFPFVTPGIYILTFALLGLAMFLAFKRHRSGDGFCREVRYAGMALAVLAFFISGPVLLRLKHLDAFAAIVLLALFAWFIFVKLWRSRGLNPSFAEQSSVFSQALDGCATFIAIDFLHYGEQHIVGNAIMNFFGGAWAFLILKLVFVLAVVELVRREKIGVNEKNYLLLLISILGFGPGARDALAVLSGVFDAPI